MNELTTWLPIVGGIIGGGGLVGLIAYLVAPASERLAFKRKDRDSILTRLADVEAITARQTVQINFLTAGVMALVAHSDELRDRILEKDKDAFIKTASQVLIDARANLNNLNGNPRDNKSDG